MISVLIPTIRGGLSQTLISLQGQGVSEVIILDEGDKSIMSDPQTRYAIDLLTLQNISVKHIRRLKVGIGRARYDLIEEATHNTCLFLDDDNVLAPYTVKKMLGVMTFGYFITPAIVQVNNEIGWTQYDYPKQCWEKKDLLDGMWESQWRNTKHKHLIPVKQTSTNCVLFNKLDADFTPLKDHNQLGEDQVFCSCFKGGLVRTDAISYHFMMKDERRKWSEQAERIYRNTLK